MKRITCFIETLAGGGAEHQMSVLCNFLCEKGYDVTLVTYADSPDHYAVNSQVKRVRLGIGKSSFRTVFSIFRFFLHVKTDCVISYRQACNARVVLPLFFRRNIKLICSERNLSGQGVKNNIERFLFLIGYSRADYIVPNSNSQKEYIINLVPKWKGKTYLIINYTDLNQFPMSKFPDDDTVIKFAVFARFSPQKNAPRFMKMIQKLKSSSDVKFHVDWFGNRGINDLDPDYLEVKNQIKELEIDDIVTLKVPVNNPAYCMNEYHSICLPSLFEGFSNSVAEGICSGKPMIVSDVSDNSVMVHDGENGFLFDPTSIDSMQNAFVKFLSLDRPTFEIMGSKSREIAENLFNKERFINDYVKLIES